MTTFEEATDKFLDWVKSENVTISPKLQLKDLRGQNQGRGLVATEDIKTDEVLFALPRSVTLSVDNCTLIKDRPDLKPKLMKLNHWDSLILVLLYEIYITGDKSPWVHYFNILPINDDKNYVFNQLMFWSPEELGYLSPSLIVERIGRDLAEAMYRKLGPMADNLNLPQLRDVSLKVYHKIASLIMSYSFDVDRPEFVGKLNNEDDDDDDDDDDQDENLDDGNDAHDDDDNNDHDNIQSNDVRDDDHANSNNTNKPKDSIQVSITNANEEHDLPGPKAASLSNITGQSNNTSPNDRSTSGSTDDEAERSILKDGFFKTMVPLADTLNADTTNHNASLFYTKKDLLMKSIKPIKKGDQIFNTYSDHPNSEILRRYGYVEISGSKYDFGEIPLSLIRQFFIDTKAISGAFLDEVLSIINQIIHTDPDDELVDVVLDSYDCFKSGEVIIELIFIIQLLTVVSALNLLNSMESLTPESKYAFISRIFKKCYQLIESKKLTKLFLSNYKKIIALRIQQYPEASSASFTEKPHLSRESMAIIVLKSEYQSLTNCLDIEKVFKTEDGNYKFIDDDKLIRNIAKKKFSGTSPNTDEDSISSNEPPSKRAKID